MYSAVVRDLESLFIDAEHKWHAVADGSLTAFQINNERTQLHKKKSAILNKYMPNTVFPSDGKLAVRAEVEAMKYFSYYYPEDALDAPNNLDSLLP